MSIVIECPGCRAEFQVPERLAGTRIRCKTCREEFRVEADEPAHDYYDDPRPRRRGKQRSPLVALAIVGGILAGCLVIAVVVVVLFARAIGEREPPQPFAAPQPFNVQPRVIARPGNKVIIGRPQPPMPPAAPAAVQPERVIPPPRPAGRTVSVPDGPMVVTLSNPRPAQSTHPDRPAYQIDYQVKDMGTGSGNDWYYLVVKAPAGTSEAVLFKLDDKPQGTIRFSFFTGSDPGQEFEAWVEREPFGKRNERKKVSQPVTVK